MSLIRKHGAVLQAWACLDLVTLHRPRQTIGLQGRQKFGTIFVCLNLCQILTDFQNYFTVRIRKKIILILSLKIPPHLKCVATLPCEVSVFIVSVIV